MKLLARDVKVIIVTAIFTSVFFTAFNIYSRNGKIENEAKKKYNPPPQNGNGGGTSYQKYWKDLVDRRNEFLNDIPPMYQQWLNPATGNPEINRLEGFVFDASQLRELLNSNKHNDGNPNRKADQVVFYIGKDGWFKRPGDPNQYWNMRLIAIGMNKHGKLMSKKRYLPKQGDDESIFDQADPCPPNGPIDPPSKK